MSLAVKADVQAVRHGQCADSEVGVKKISRGVEKGSQTSDIRNERAHLTFQSQILQHNGILFLTKLLCSEAARARDVMHITHCLRTFVTDCAPLYQAYLWLGTESTPNSLRYAPKLLYD